VHLRRELHQLPSFPWAKAALEAGRLSRRPLPRALRVWQPALQVARAILRDETVRPVASEAGVVAQHWWLDTSKLWEAILRQALGEQVKQAASDAGAPRKTPWADLGNTKQPDLILELEGGRCVVADAKYKRLANASLSAADQYQIFTYSHITWLDQPPTEAWILYPCPPEAYLPPQKEDAHARYPHAEARTEGFKLWIKPVPFPTRKQLDPPAWDAYINKAREAIKAP
jgi:5-methylcytosine-specific restriction endonuclease McrBC regulatory subunit McrC